ncbi:origin recognition complex subunit 1 isoform X1 [Osmia bicornis bicornis]|uniref:origin recognition complex subunit 1 isoform X1 n=2 Tax=Osmia bicornis bicornis TaxID=1437191 RepID=UPI0010F7D6C7|nr:origin recognition complex subunit 1 isoform X1 [Osmia bicornis bicornis]
MIYFTNLHQINEEEPINTIVNNLPKKKNIEVQNTVKRNMLKVTSNKEGASLLSPAKHVLPKCDTLKNEDVSIKLKLRRSTEQSLYKIDTDSECEKLTTNKSHNKFLKQKKISHLELKVTESYNENKDDSDEEVDINDKNKLKVKQNETEVSRGTRNRRPPSRFSAYQCDILPVLRSSPSLRRRKTINYNEDKLLVNSIISNMETGKNVLKLKENKESGIASDSHSSKDESLNSNTRNNKRHHISSIKDNEYDSNPKDLKIVKVKSITKPNISEKDMKRMFKYCPERMENTEKPDLSIPICNTPTPVKANNQKRMISESKQKNIQYINNNKDNSEDLADMYKRIKISSAVKTPTSTNKKKRMVTEEVQNNVQFMNDNKSITEDEWFANTPRYNKVLSVKKNILTPQNQNNVQISIESRLEETHLSTPKSRSIKYSNLTPSMRKRSGFLSKPTTPLQEARSRLHVCSIPKSLPCREEEFNNIFTFLRGKLEDKSGGCIYISGVPGTGKTATVNEAVRCLQKLNSKGQLDDFNYIAINGMKLTEPRQAYVQILKQLDGKIVTWEQAYHILDKRFHRTNSKMTLLLVDELDFLCTKRQDVIYNLLDWPTKATAQLVVITIANTMDLPERVLMGRVTSRLGLTRLTFQPYNYKQLQEIVMSRLKDFNGFRSEAVQLVARKVSAVSGDARRALDICRRAMEIAESRNAETISLQDVTEAVSEMIASAKVQAIKHCSKMEQIFLQAVSAEVTRTSVEEVYFKDAYYQLESLCSFDGIEVPTVTETLAVCSRLGASRLLICEHSKNDIYQKLLLNVSVDDVHYALHELNSHLVCD